MVSFAFGTDTGGSGRVPASYNGIYGYKPAPGAWSRAGLVYACRSFDTATVFAKTLEDVAAVDAAVAGPDPADAFSATHVLEAARAPRLAMAPGIDTFGDADIAALYTQAHAAVTQGNSGTAAADIAPFQAINDLMFFGPMLAERDVSVGAFIDAQPDACHPVVRNLVQGSRSFTAADTYRAIYRVQEAKAAIAPFWEAHDALILPTVGALITRQMCEDDPLGPNFRNGTYTNFANPLGLASVSVPFGRTPAGVPWGLTAYAPATRVPTLFKAADRLRAVTQATA